VPAGQSQTVMDSSSVGTPPFLQRVGAPASVPAEPPLFAEGGTPSSVDLRLVRLPQATSTRHTSKRVDRFNAASRRSLRAGARKRNHYISARTFVTQKLYDVAAMSTFGTSWISSDLRSCGLMVGDVRPFQHSSTELVNGKLFTPTPA